MSPRFDEVARLNNLLGRRDAIIEREKDTRAVNHGIVGRMEIDQDIRNAAPWLLEVAGCFQPGDANEIAYAMDVLVSDSRYTGDPRVLTRLLRAAKIVEEKESTTHD